MAEKGIASCWCPNGLLPDWDNWDHRLLCGGSWWLTAGRDRQELGTHLSSFFLLPPPLIPPGQEQSLWGGMELPDCKKKKLHLKTATVVTACVMNTNTHTYICFFICLILFMRPQLPKYGRKAGTSSILRKGSCIVSARARTPRVRTVGTESDGPAIGISGTFTAKLPSDSDEIFSRHC